jgi:hypothetical protein
MSFHSGETKQMDEHSPRAVVVFTGDLVIAFRT